jgi:hypothetical protein
MRACVGCCLGSSTPLTCGVRLALVRDQDHCRFSQVALGYRNQRISPAQVSLSMRTDGVRTQLLPHQAGKQLCSPFPGADGSDGICADEAFGGGVRAQLSCTGAGS